MSIAGIDGLDSPLILHHLVDAVVRSRLIVVGDDTCCLSSLKRLHLILVPLPEVPSRHHRWPHEHNGVVVHHSTPPPIAWCSETCSLVMVVQPAEAHSRIDGNACSCGTNSKTSPTLRLCST